MEAEVPRWQHHTGSENSGKFLTAQELYQRDPVLRLLRDKWHVSIIWLIIVSTLLLTGQYFGVQTLAGLPFTPKGMLTRPLNIFSTVLFYGIYFALPDTIANLFNTLIDDRVVLIDKPLQDQNALPSPQTVFVGKFVGWIGHWIWLALTLPFIAAYPLYRLLGPYIAATPLPLWLRFIGGIIDFSVGYTCVLSIERIVVTLVFLNRLLRKFTVYINPLHPDGAGGLGILSQILWSSAGIMLGVALSFYVDAILSSRIVDLTLLIVAYAVLIPTLWVGWLMLPHRVMLHARKAALQPLTEEYNKVISEMRPVAEENAAAIVAGTERLTALTQRYEVCHHIFPVWPIEVMQMRQLLVAFILPALIAFIPAIPVFVQFFSNIR